MSDHASAGSLLGKRKRKRDRNPNPLFSKWLAEWRDEAREKGWKSEYIYSKALKSLQKYPLRLSTGKECKILQHFGDKICKMLDDRLLKEKQEQGNEASFDSTDTDFPTVQSSTLARTSRLELPVVVHQISDSSDSEVSDAHSYKSVSRRPVTELMRHDNMATKTTVAGVNGKHAMSTDDTGTDVSDDDVTFIGETSSVDTDHNIYVCDDDGDEFSTLCELPDLDEGCESNRTICDRGVDSSSKLVNKDCAEGVGATVASVTTTMTHCVTDSDDDQVELAASPQHKGRQTREPREYIPAYRSGPYAILLTLFRHAQDPNFCGFMTKAELCQAAQPLADKSFVKADPGSRYTAWSSVSILLRKGFLIKESSPAKYRLTDLGHELGRRLEDVEIQRSAADSCSGSDEGSDKDADEVGVHRSSGRAVAHQSDATRTQMRDDSHSHTTQVLCDTAAAHRTDNTRRKPQKRKTQMRRESNILTTANMYNPAHNSLEDVSRLPASDGTGISKEIHKETENDICVVVDDVDVTDDDEDDLPSLALPSLAQRLKPSSCISSSVSGATSEGSRLQYWYVAEDDKLVTRKDQASVVLDDHGVSFLVKINYQLLLQSGLQYRLDMTRPLGDDFVFAYLADSDCYKMVNPPENGIGNSTFSTTSVVQTADLPAKFLESAAKSRLTNAGRKTKTVHAISDSDSEPESSNIRHHKMPAAHTSDFEAKSRARPRGTSSSSSTRARMVCSTAKSGIGGMTNSVVSTSADTSGLPSVTSSQSSVDSVKSSVSESVADFVLYPDTFEVVLCVDNREFYGSQSSSKSLLPDLIKNGVTCDLRLLNVGDVLWVAREKVPMGKLGSEQPVRRELVLNYVVERKRMDDLVSSITSGRLREQKFRLKHSGLQEKIILIESYGSMQHFSISEDRIKQAIANTEIIDGFTVKQTKDSKETAAYLTLMTRYLQSFYQNKTLRSCSQESLKELQIKFHVRDPEQMLMPFDLFNQAALKNKPLTVMELFGKQLIQLWGMSADKAKAIVDKYPSPTRLFEAYASCTTEKEKEALLANVKYGKNQRNLGISLSRQVAQLYTSKVLT